jgi:hypothetical protein
MLLMQHLADATSGGCNKHSQAGPMALMLWLNLVN